MLYLAELQIAFYSSMFDKKFEMVTAIVLNELFAFPFLYYHIPFILSFKLEQFWVLIKMIFQDIFDTC